ncbi:ShlB/FhaC/HecB family hemolysin secretion/activation protein [Teredinibacter franksiae]|uniref:ShlB/FhaC/HecB family hemolysin secretion/activation protein n=1 Tax=Teredinibacter franksiae TaxID=2761453 RepID=UPI001624A219|nr:ShlB/FhaC/HecB family hemolysin secretion/activation protein [Teredinibacter franksiae]
MKLINFRVFLAFTCTFYLLQANAGFLEMPNTKEVPEYEEETMRLDLDVPNVRERDPDPQGGPRLNVQEFRVQGIVEYPDLGITREALIKRIEEIRFELMKEGALLDSGYTLDEVGEVSDLLAEIEDETEGEHVSPVEVQRLVFLIRDQRRKRGVTLGMIESVADVITRFYRERGFILAKAYIPEQHVRDGVVTLTLLLGELGEVAVNGNNRHSDRMIQRVFDSSMGEPVTTKDIEERLYLVNDMPGVSSRGYFEPGSQVGDTKLNVNVVDEAWYDANVRIDNHGAPGSGEYRLYSDVFLYSPFGLADQLQLGFLASFEPMNSTYGLIRYQTNILHPRLSLYAGASTNDFTLDQTIGGDDNSQEINYKGDSVVVDGGASWKLKRSRVSNHSVDLNFSQIESSIGFEDQGTVFKDSIQNTTVSYTFDTINERKRRLHQGTVSAKSSEIIQAAQDTLETQSYILSYDYALLTFAPLPFTKAESRLIMRSSGQYSGSSVSPSVQFGLGGPLRARGFDVNQFYADYGLYAGVDWQFNGFGGDKAEFYGEKLRNIFQPYLLADTSYGYKYPLENNASDATEASYANVGIGVKISFKKMRGNLAFSRVLVDDVSSIFEEEEKKSGSKLYLDFQYSF